MTSAAVKTTTPNKNVASKTSSKVSKKTPASEKTSTSSHPPYKNMIKKAISTLNEKGGSSKIAITKYISANYQINEKAALQVRLTLRKMVQEKEVVHASSKSVGANGSFKLPAKEAKVAQKASTAVKKTPEKSPVKKAAAASKVVKAAKETKSARKANSPKKTKSAASKKPVAKKAAKKSK